MDWVFLNITYKMGFLVNLGILICILISIVIVVTVVILRYKEEEEIRDNPLAINWMSANCDGRAIGVEKNTVLGKDGRKVITISPRDVDSKNLKELNDVTVIVDKNKLISFPKGSLSSDKNINMYLPPSPDLFSDNLKQTEFGKMLMFWTSLKGADNALIDSLKEGMKIQSAHVKSLAGGEVSIEKMTQLEELFQEALKAVQDTKRDKSSGYPPTGVPPSSY